MNKKTTDNYKTRLDEIMRVIASKSGRLRPREDTTDELFRHYEKYINVMQKNMPQRRDDEQEKDIPLDHHKIAAALCCSVLKVKPIGFETDKSDPPLASIEQSANELCAFLFGLQVIQDFWSARCKENIPAEEKAIYSNPVRTPQPNSSKATYSDWFVKLIKSEAFKYLDYESNLFGEELIFFLSHIYYMIESYSFEYYKSALAEKRSKSKKR